MSRTVFTPGEAPFTSFEVLDLPLFKDPGDGCGQLGYLEGDLRQTISKALRGDIPTLQYCLKLLTDHEANKLNNGEWPRRPPQRPQITAFPPSIADVLVTLGIARERDKSEVHYAETPGIMIEEWAIECAHEHQGRSGGYDGDIDDWHKRGSPDEVRFTAVVFDL